MAGALAGILLTTKSGQEVRWDLKDYARLKQRYLLRQAKKARAALDDAIERSKGFLSKHEPMTEKDAENPKPDLGREEAPPSDAGDRT